MPGPFWAHLGDKAHYPPPRLIVRLQFRTCGGDGAGAGGGGRGVEGDLFGSVVVVVGNHLVGSRVSGRGRRSGDGGGALVGYGEGVVVGDFEGDGVGADVEGDGEADAGAQ